ncbi:transcription factor 7-like 1-A isoform X2 [Synchiropus splendidus]|uniref:transcription factor 7-like 1-A isoform X2 n=1 Tax=Synchiropus splendidus TaxID=270530 RepID=UPI00237D4F8E|nr:transcription factor 7-like 1-A isoform X2 [Synchiropus splendidus]
MPQLSGGDSGHGGPDSGVRDELGARDELIRFEDEGDQEKQTEATDRDLDDVKSSLVNESETHSGSEADRRSRPDPGGRTRSRQVFEDGVRRQPEACFPPYLGYPFFMFPDLCSPYLSGGAHPYLPFQWPLLDVQARTSGRDTPAHTHRPSGVPVLPPHMSLHPLLSYNPEASPGFPSGSMLSRPSGATHFPAHDGLPQVPQTFGWLSGQSIYPLTGGFSPALPMSASISSLMSGGFSPGILSPPPSSSPPRVTVAMKQDAESSSTQQLSSSPAPPPQQQQQQQQQQLHIKKPLNAFMLFMRDQRPHVVAECSVKESATINQILGQRWHSLSKEEQSKYYDLARKERLLHSKLYPGWSARDNYGRKKKRKRPKNDSTDPADGCPPQVKRALSSSGLEWSHTHMHSASAEPRPVGVSHLTHTHLSQSSPASSLGSPATPTASLASPAAPAPTQTDHTHNPICTGQYSEQLQPLSLNAKHAHAPGTSASATYGVSSHTPTPSALLPLPHDPSAN